MTHVSLAPLFFVRSSRSSPRTRSRRDVSARKAGPRRPGRGALIAVLAAFLLIGTPLAAKYAGELEFPWNREIEPEPEQEPELPLPAKDPEDVYSQGPGSLLRSFSMSYYNLKETTARNETALTDHLVGLLDENRENRVSFSLPEEITVRGGAPSDRFAVADSRAAYDGQILDAYGKVGEAKRSDRAYQYHRIGVTALNCLDDLSRKCEDQELSYRDQWEEFLYYGELAVWALLNEYVFTPDLTGGERVDLSYRIAQAYDHVGTAATDADPPFKHELYFVSAAFLEMSLRSLKAIGFSRKGHEYHSAVWKLHMTMHLRMGKYVDAHEDFFTMVDDCKACVSELSLTEGEREDIEELASKLSECRTLYGTAPD